MRNLKIAALIANNKIVADLGGNAHNYIENQN